MIDCCNWQSLSFARVIQQPTLEIWRGEEANVLKAQLALSHRASALSGFEALTRPG